MTEVDQQFKYATKAVKKYIDLFGFGHYTVVVGRLPEDESKDDWANCIWSLEEEWAVIRFGDISNFDKRQIDHLVIHEVTHILIGLANSGPAMEEVVCNRVATGIAGPRVGARGIQIHTRTMTDQPADALDNPAPTTPDAASSERRFTDEELHVIKETMPQVILRLPRQPRELLCRIFFDGATLSEIAEEEGVNRSTIMRRRDAALKILRAYYDAGAVNA